MKTNKLSLEDFKRKNRKNSSNDLDKISGGILGACHCTTSTDTYYVYYSNGGGSSNTAYHTVCVK